MMDKSVQIWPVEIRCNSDRNKLNVLFDNGKHVEISAELLRVESPSAEVQGHGQDQKQTPLNKQDVTITKITAVGSYAVRLTFSDGHDTGIYSWELLHDYGHRKEQLMADYQQRAEALR
tara:strand:- start:427 stop:783 length:357 start_codon:yes stop_codon:yes gene_type:complete